MAIAYTRRMFFAREFFTRHINDGWQGNDFWKVSENEFLNLYILILQGIPFILSPTAPF